MCTKHYRRLNKHETTSILNDATKLSISEIIINNRDSTQNYKNNRIKVIQQCSNVFDIVKKTAILIYL